MMSACTQNTQQDGLLGTPLLWRTWCVFHAIYLACSHNLVPMPELIPCLHIIVCSPLTLPLLSDPSTHRPKRGCTDNECIIYHAAQSLLGSITLHAANKTGMPIACCLASISTCCTFWVCYCRLSQRCCLRGLLRRAPLQGQGRHH